MKKEIIGDERRYFQTGVTIETREAGTASRKVVGYALKFSTLSRDLGGFMEQISPKALEGVDLTDVVCLFNHDKNYILARTSSNTLKLTVDETGLKYEFEAPETTVGNDLLVSIGRGDVSGSSFAFRTGLDKWERVGDNIIRTILNFERVVDVSPVVFPAYSEADVAKRSMEEWVKDTVHPVTFKNLEITKTLIELNRK